MFRVAVVLVEPPDVALPDGVTMVRIERSTGGSDGLFTWPPTLSEGQMLVVVNEDDNIAVVAFPGRAICNEFGRIHVLTAYVENSETLSGWAYTRVSL
jgi:hypothetical protein